MKDQQVQAKVRRDWSEMSPLMAEYASGSETQAAFCAARGLKVGTFQYWWRRYRSEAEGQPASGFVALLAHQEVSAEVGEIELRYGAVRLGLLGMPADYVAELVRELADYRSGSC